MRFDAGAAPVQHSTTQASLRLAHPHATQVPTRTHRGHRRRILEVGVAVSARCTHNTSIDGCSASVTALGHGVGSKGGREGAQGRAGTGCWKMCGRRMLLVLGVRAWGYNSGPHTYTHRSLPRSLHLCCGCVWHNTRKSAQSP